MGGTEGADCTPAEDMERDSCCDCGQRTEGHKAPAVGMNGRERVHETVPRALGMGERRRRATQEPCQAAPATEGKVSRELGRGAE